MAAIVCRDQPLTCLTLGRPNGPVEHDPGVRDEWSIRL